MNCPHCQTQNEALTRAGQRLYYRCERCRAVYWGLPAEWLPASSAPMRQPVDYDAIRALLRRARARHNKGRVA